MRLSTSTCMYFNRPDGTKARIEDCIKMCSEAGYRVMDMNFLDCTNFDTPISNREMEEWCMNWQSWQMKTCRVFSGTFLFL